MVEAARSGSKELRTRPCESWRGSATSRACRRCWRPRPRAAELSPAAKAALAHLPAADVDADLLVRLPEATGHDPPGRHRARGAAADRWGRSRVRAVRQDADAGVRGTAVQAIGLLGRAGQVRGLVSCAERRPRGTTATWKRPSWRSAAARAGCMPSLPPLMQSDDARTAWRTPRDGDCGWPRRLGRVERRHDRQTGKRPGRGGPHAVHLAEPLAPGRRRAECCCRWPSRARSPSTRSWACADTCSTSAGTRP